MEFSSKSDPYYAYIEASSCCPFERTHFSIEKLNVLLSCVRVVGDWFRYASSASMSDYLLSPGYRFQFVFRASPSPSAVASLTLC